MRPSLTVIAVSLALNACAINEDGPLASAGGDGGAPPDSDLAKFVEAGAKPVSAATYAEIMPGNTKVGDGWVVYFGPNGTKRVLTIEGDHIERRWRLNDDGAICEELAKSGAEVCDSDGGLYHLNGVYRAFRPDGSASPLDFVIIEGEADLSATELTTPPTANPD